MISSSPRLAAFFGLLVVFSLSPIAKTHAQVANFNPPVSQAAPGTEAGANPAGSPASGTQTLPSTPGDTDKSSIASVGGIPIPKYDPGSEIFEWNGFKWNIYDNRVFQARFEKYLNAQEETSEADQAYQNVMDTMMAKLAPGRATPASMDEAFALLPQASNYESDARLCDDIANAVYAVWLSKREDARMRSALNALEQERKRHEWNIQVSRGSSGLAPTADNAPDAATRRAERQMETEARTLPHVTRLAEVNAALKANEAKRQLSEVQAKIEFQALLVQLFMQRRFQHVLLGTRFYRTLFGDGDTRLQLKGDAEKFFKRSTGLPPTVGILDSLANEAVRDANEGVRTYQFLVDSNELASGSKRLADAFVIGEFLPSLRTLPRVEKRKTLAFTQKINQLLSALDVKDYTLADQLLPELRAMASDFDDSKPRAVIETSRTIASMHLAKARNAAVAGDREGLETELRLAAEIWPRNPALNELSTSIFSQSDVQQRAMVDFDQLLSQKNYRQIYEDRVRFIAATALYPDRVAQLQEVLENMQAIEGTLIQAREIAKRGDSAGAWEAVERIHGRFPNDLALSEMRATLTTSAADFVRTLRNAEDLEGRGQVGSSLAWYLKARQLYPPSDFAREGIDRLVNQIFPEDEH